MAKPPYRKDSLLRHNYPAHHPEDSMGDEDVFVPSTFGAQLATTDDAEAARTLLGVRDVLSANRTYYVRTDGNDNNTGLVNNAGGAFLTIQKALDVVLGTLDLKGFSITIQVGAGTFPAAISFASAQVGAGNISILGDVTTPANVTVGPIVVDGGGCRLFLAGCRVSKGIGISCIQAKNGGFIRLSGRNEFTSTSGGHRIMADFGSIDAISPEVISGSVDGGHYFTQRNGVINCEGATWTSSGTATQGSGFAMSTSGGVVFAFANSFTGTFVGPRYLALVNGVVLTHGGGANYFPGNSIGSVGSGGQYA